MPGPAARRRRPPPAGLNLDHSRYRNRFLWTALTSPAVLAVWIITAWQKGDQWAVATAYMAVTVFVWTVPSAEQVVKMIQAASVLRTNPLDSLGYGGLPPMPDANAAAGATAPVAPKEAPE